jgi:hypothetical protein
LDQSPSSYSDIADEIEKGRELGITDSLGVGFVAFGEAVQEG